MESTVPSQDARSDRGRKSVGRPAVGVRELKARASAIIHDVSGRRVTYAVTKRGIVAALIVPADAGERLSGASAADPAWEAWEALVAQLSHESEGKAGSALAELEQMRR